MINRARAMVTGLAALAALVLVVAGLPVVLYRFGGSPLPGQIAGWHRIAAVLVSRDDGSLLVGVIRACSWLAWLLFTACVLTEAQAAIRGRYPPHLRLGGLQGTAAYLVALVALGFAAPSAITLSASAAAIAQPGSASHPGPASDAGSPMSGYLGAPEAPQADLDAYGAVASRLVVVRAGDCLWSLAERYLGAGDRYPEIASLNYGHEMGDGQVFTSASFIEPGWQLLVPGTAAAGPVRADGSGGMHLGHSTADAHYSRRHPAASTRVARGRPTSAHGAAAPEARTASRTAA
ncbi:MAG TPA: hypothetical protein VK836_05515, partial [Streptosporangiaceae bacterium]|nr:hypothetical protein [Streptosporangiaceae bacterium]